jgi:hypothetical protein
MMWLLRLLRGRTDASHIGDDVLHGAPCKRLAVKLDLEQASAATTDGLRAPAVDRFERLRALPATVWIDGQYIRRVHFSEVLPRELTLELWDYGVPTDDLNWSRLPTFKSPDENALYAGEQTPWHRRLRRRLNLTRTSSPTTGRPPEDRA